ncbi:MAG: hemerythrin family protein [Paludibacter sp.]
METIKNSQHSWNDSYLVNIPLIDKQHMKFFKIFDQLYALSTEEDNYDKLGSFIDELDRYTHIHFKTEEALMRKANTPDYELHLLQHSIFLRKIEEFKVAYSYKNTVLHQQMINFMRKWFLMHISDVDSKYADSVQELMHEKGWAVE